LIKHWESKDKQEILKVQHSREEYKDKNGNKQENDSPNKQKNNQQMWYGFRLFIFNLHHSESFLSPVVQEGAVIEQEELLLEGWWWWFEVVVVVAVLQEQNWGYEQWFEVVVECCDGLNRNSLRLQYLPRSHVYLDIGDIYTLM
jgi:hypothetical protein